MLVHQELLLSDIPNQIPLNADETSSIFVCCEFVFDGFRLVPRIASEDCSRRLLMNIVRQYSILYFTIVFSSTMKILGINEQDLNLKCS